MQIAVELPNENIANKVLTFLEHLKTEGVKVFKDDGIQTLNIERIKENDPDYQLILKGREERIKHPENYGSFDDIDFG